MQGRGYGEGWEHWWQETCTVVWIGVEYEWNSIIYNSITISHGESIEIEIPCKMEKSFFNLLTVTQKHTEASVIAGASALWADDTSSIPSNIWVLEPKLSIEPSLSPEHTNCSSMSALHKKEQIKNLALQLIGCLPCIGWSGFNLRYPVTVPKPY